MPSKSASQAKFMRAIAHSPAFAKKVGVKQSVGKDFEMADKKMKKFGRGGMPKESTTGPSTTVPTTTAAQKERRDFEDETRKQNMKAQEAGVRAARSSPDAHAKGGKVLKRIKIAKKTMRKGSGLADLMGRALAARAAGAGTPPMAPPTGPDMGAGAPPMGMPGMKKGGKAKAKPFAATKFGAAMMKKSGDTKGRAMKKFAKGGSIDGIAQRGKTKTKKVAMGMGGMAGYKHGGKTR